MGAAEAVRLFAGAPHDRPMTLAEHLMRYERPPAAALQPDALIGTVERAGLRGHGGADFPAATKMQAVRRRGRSAVVVANGAEGEPLSAKDKVLLASVPHLVLDGAVFAAGAVGASEVVICVTQDAAHAVASVERALQERAECNLDPVPVRGVTVPNRYLAGEESALVNLLNGGPPKPTFTPPRPFERGVRGRPTLVQNVETLAHLAQIVRFGADWFRELGTDADPGSALVTLCGAFREPGVCEIACETSLREIVEIAGGTTEPVQAFLVGGYFGSWFSADRALDLPLGHSRMREAGGSLGSGVIGALPASACGVRESARVLDYMAAQTSGQCGPCVHGLRAIAGGITDIVDGRSARDARAHLTRWCDDVVGRGACHHPDGAVRFLRSGLTVFADEVDRHEHRGECSASSWRPVLSVPGDERERAA